MQPNISGDSIGVCGLGSTVEQLLGPHWNMVFNALNTEFGNVLLTKEDVWLKITDTVKSERGEKACSHPWSFQNLALLFVCDHKKVPHC